MENISYSDGVKYEDVLHRVKKERNIVYKIKERKANWVGHTLYGNCLLNRLSKKKETDKDVSSYWMTLRNTANTGVCKKKQQIL